MFRSYFLSWKWAPLAFGGAIILLSLFYFQVETSSRLGEWMQVLGDVVSGSKDYSLEQLLDKFIFEAVKIAAILIGIGAVINLVSSLYCWFWYEAMTYYYLPNWNKTLRDIDGPSQRLEVSIKEFVNKFLGVVKSSVRAILVLFMFVPQIWALSKYYDFFYFSEVPGKLFWIVLIICIVALMITSFFGINLKKCRYDINDAEAVYRSALEFFQRNKNRDDSCAKLTDLMINMRKKNLRLFHNKLWYDLWIGLYAQLWSVLPITFFGYNVFSGFVKYGIVSKTSYALGEVINALSTPIWLYEEITNIKSVALRITELEASINYPKNWREIQKETGWEDRRAVISPREEFVEPLPKMKYKGNKKGKIK